MQLTTVQRRILVGLLSASKPVVAADIAQALNMSSGTVNKQLPAVEWWLNKQGYDLVSTPGTGLSVRASAGVKRSLIDELANEECPPSALGPDDRRDLIRFILHTSSRPLITQYFQNLLHVSRSTILRDLSNIAEWYEERDLFLMRRPNFGSKLAGKETDWRKAFIEIVLHHLDEPTLLCLSAEEDLPSCPLALFNPPLAALMSEHLSGLPLLWSRERIRFAESELRTRFVDSDHLALTLSIALSIRRVGEGRSADMDAAHLAAIVGNPAYRVALDIARMIQASFNVIIPRNEVGHLAAQLLGAKPDSRMPVEVPAEADLLAQTVLDRASQILKRSLNRDDELLTRLAMHIASTIRRLMFNLPIRNPLLDEIRNRYPEVYGAAEEGSAAIGEFVGRPVPDDEVAYITMYLAGAVMRNETFHFPKILIVCPSGAATSWLLHARLAREIPNAPIIDVLSTRDLQRGVPRDVDLIVSTVPLHDVSTPTVVVSALLSPEDLEALQHAIQSLSVSSGRLNEKNEYVPQSTC